MMPRTRRGLAILVAGAVVVIGFQLAERSTIADDLAAADASAAEWSAVLAETSTQARALGAQHAGLAANSATYDELIAARAVFVTSLGTVDAAFTSASGKVDTSAQRADILALQQKVLVERGSVDVVDEAATHADGVAQAVTTAVEDYDREQARQAAARAAAAAAASSSGFRSSGAGAAGAPAGPVAGGYDRVRAALDRVGGGGVALQEFSGACGGASAAACASSSGVIFFSPGLASWPDGRLRWAMAHELAHIHQFRVWGSLMASGSYASLFGGNVELLANCMAAQRGYGSANVSCSGAQLGFAGAIWGGGVPG